MRPCQHLISLLLCLNLVLAVVVSKIDDDDQGPHLTRRQEFSFDPDVTDGGGSFDPEGNPMFPTDGTIPDGTDVNGGTDVGGDPNVEGGKDTPSETSYGSGSDTATSADTGTVDDASFTNNDPTPVEANVISEDSLASDFDYDNYEDESDCLTGSLLKLRKRRNCQIAEITDYEVSLEGLKTNINNAMSITETLSQAKAAAVPDIVTIEDLQTQQTGAIKAIQESANDLPTKEAAFGDHLGKITGNPKIPEEFNADVDPSQELKLPDFQIKNRAFDANLVEVADGSDLQIKVRTSEGKLYSDAEWRAITAMVSTSVYISSVATTAGSDVPDDDDLPDECNPNPPQPSPTDVNLPKKSNKWCSASFKNMKFPQPQVDWTKQSTTHSASASAYQITGTLVIVCNPPKDVTKDTALTDKVSTTFMDTSEDAPTSENACMKATDTYAQPYVKMTAGAEYTLFGGGEVDIDFEVDVGIQATSIEDVESDQPTSSGDMSPSVDVIVTKVASSIKDVNAKATFELVLGYKEVIAGQDFLDIGLDTTISATLTAAQLSGDLVSNSGDSASSVSSSSIATTLSTVVLSATSTTTQVTATSSSAVPSASETPGIFCLTQVNVSGGIASAFFVKFMSKQVFNKDLIQSGVADAKTTFGTDICSQISDASLS